MIAIRKTLRMLCANERGATAIEHGLIASLTVVAMIAGLNSVGMWGLLGTKISTAMRSSRCAISLCARRRPPA